MACNFPSPLHSLYESKYLALTYSELLLVCDSVTINITNDMAKAVREETVKQTESKLWFKFRAGRITASRMKQACHTDPAMPSQSLVKAICYPEAYKICTQATQWGCQHETFALEQYTSSQSSKHQVFSVKNCGLFLNPKWPHLGASPDSIVACDCCGKGAVEIKCPLCNKDEDIEATVLNSKSCLIVVDGSIHLDKKHAYYYQVQTQIFVCEVPYCDFCVCTFPESSPSMHIERIYPDPEFWHVCVSKAEHFFKVCILPELIGKWYTRPIQNATPRTCTSAASTSASVSETTEPTKHLYCYCRQPEPTDGSASSEMIGCDNPQCSIEWFHTKCLKLKSVPKCRWYCPDCRLLPEYSRKRRKREE